MLPKPVLVPTKKFWLVIALGIPVSAIGAQAGTPLLFWAYNLGAIALLLVTAKLGPTASMLKLTRRTDAVLSVRASNRIDLVIENVGTDPIAFELRDEPPPNFLSTHREFRLSLRAGGIAERHYFVTPRYRGSDYFRATVVRLRCPLDLVLKQVELPTNAPLRVYPNVLALREFDLLNQQGRLREIGIRRTRVRGIGTEFESLREYAEGDDYRKLDWKATARRGKLVVRQYEVERNQSVIIAIDIGRHMLGEVNGITKLDHALDACLMLAQAAAIAGDQVGLFVYADTVVRYIPPRKGRNQVGIIIEALHDLAATPVETDNIAAFSYLSSRWKRRALIVNFTDSGDGPRAKELGGALIPITRRHLVLLARVSDPKLRETLEAVITDESGLYRKAAGLLIDEDRRKATSILRTFGLHSLESEPQDLAMNLVTFYFDAKQRALI